MTPSDTLPDWLPPPGEPIGVERARAYIAWIRANAGPYLRQAEQLLRDAYPHITEIRRSSTPVRQLATWDFGPPMTHLCIGSVWAPIGGGTWAMVDISITADGRLDVRPGWNMPR